MNNCHPISIFRGDDTDAFGLRTITIKLTGDLDLTTAKAKFVLLGYTKDWASIPSTGELTMVMSAADTKAFPVGLAFGTLTLIDGTKNLTVCNTIPFEVTNRVDTKQIDEFDIDVKLSVDTEINIAFSVKGPKGDKGDTGDTGTIAVGTVTTLEAGQPATVQNVGTATAAIFNFGIPKGQDGVAGWEKEGEKLKPTIAGVTGIALPALENTASISGKYTLADVKNLCNALLAALKG